MKTKSPLKAKRWLAGTAGAALFAGTAAYVAWAARQAETAHPPKGRFIDVNKVRVHYLEKGEGPVILLLHGKGSMATDFQGSGLIDGLATHHRVIAIDRPGFGYSERPRGKKWDATEQAQLIAATLGQLGIPSAIVVGHSWGAMCAIALALEAPHLVERLVLMSGYYYPSTRPDALIMGAAAVPVIGDVMRYTTSAMTARVMLGYLHKRTFSPQPIYPGFSKAVPRDLLLRPSQMFAEAQESLMMVKEAERLSDSYADLKMPITILAGSEDGALKTEEQSVKLHQALPHSKLKVVEKAGHMLHYSAPQVVLAAIEEAAHAAKKGPAVKAPVVNPQAATPFTQS
ncbi:MAG TPA: alpha/beta hydrolase [Burkholderiales bacterium]|nr:alpha/beta hydrolase [Burkholderiales bacterium]